MNSAAETFIVGIEFGHTVLSVAEYMGDLNAESIRISYGNSGSNTARCVVGFDADSGTLKTGDGLLDQDVPLMPRSVLKSLENGADWRVGGRSYPPEETARVVVGQLREAMREYFKASPVRAQVALPLSLPRQTAEALLRIMREEQWSVDPQRDFVTQPEAALLQYLLEKYPQGYDGVGLYGHCGGAICEMSLWRITHTPARTELELLGAEEAPEATGAQAQNVLISHLLYEGVLRENRFSGDASAALGNISGLANYAAGLMTTLCSRRDAPCPPLTKRLRGQYALRESSGQAVMVAYATFADLLAPLQKRFAEKVAQLTAREDISGQKPGFALLTGSAARIPAFKEAFRSALPNIPLAEDRDRYAARGAALIGAIRYDEETGRRLSFHASHAGFLGVCLDDGTLDPLLGVEETSRWEIARAYRLSEALPAGTPALTIHEGMTRTAVRGAPLCSLKLDGFKPPRDADAIALCVALQRGDNATTYRLHAWQPDQSAKWTLEFERASMR